MKNIVMVFILFFSALAWSQGHVISDPVDREKYRVDSINSLKKGFTDIKNSKIRSPLYDQTFSLEALGRDILKFEVADKQGTVIHNQKQKEITIDFDNDQCLKNIKNYCDAVVRDQVSYQKDYQKTYQPQKIVYPQIDLENMTYTMPNGVVYDLNKGAVVKAATPTQVATTSSTDPTKVEQKVETPIEQVQYDDVEATKSSEDKTCEWDDTKSKRSLSGLSCEEKVCSSWVICTKNGRKSRALASCSMDLCVDGKATECVAQKGYGSIKLDFKNTTASGNQAPANKQKTQN